MSRATAWALLLALCLAPALRAQDEPSPSERPAQPAAEELKRELQEVLAGPEYQHYRDRESFRDRVKEALANLWRSVSDLWRRATGGVRLPALVGLPWLWWLVAACVAAGVLALLIRYALAGRRRRPGAPPAESGGPQLPARDPADLLAEAARLAEAGDFRGAVRSVYLGALVRLHRAGLLPREEANTNWEYLRAVEGRPPVHEPLSHLTAIVDRIWYGHQRAVSDDYSRCRSFADDVGRGISEAT
jgi:hypothetical protein